MSSFRLPNIRSYFVGNRGGLIRVCPSAVGGQLLQPASCFDSKMATQASQEEVIAWVNLSMPMLTNSIEWLYSGVPFEESITSCPWFRWETPGLRNCSNQSRISPRIGRSFKVKQILVSKVNKDQLHRFPWQTSCRTTWRICSMLRSPSTAARPRSTLRRWTAVYVTKDISELSKQPFGN